MRMTGVAEDLETPPDGGPVPVVRSFQNFVKTTR